jgi:hypothetical protein
MLKVLAWIAYGLFAVSVLRALIGLSDGDLNMLISSCFFAMLGVIFLALEKIVSTLEDIKNSLITEQGGVKSDSRQAPPRRKTRLLQDIAHDIKALKSRRKD